MRGVRGAVVIAVVLAAASLSPAAAEVRPLVSDLPRAADLAASPAGQSVACVDQASGAIVLLDPRHPGTKRVAVDPPAAGQPVPVALGFVDDTVLAAVCRAGEEWSLRTWRLRADAAVEASAAMQTVALPRGDGEPAAVHLVVGRARGWLAVTGLDPLVVRAPLAGVSVGRFSARHCPRVAAGSLPVAAAVGPGGELVVCTAESGPDGTTDAVAYYGVDGGRLLDLGTGLRGIRDLAFAPDGSAVYVVAAASGSADAPAGLWRLDASLEDGRQAIHPRLVAPLDEPVAVACPAPTLIVVAHGSPERVVAQVEPEVAP